MDRAIDLLVMALAGVLAVAGIALVWRELLGDRGRRRRVPALRCPGGWVRRWFILPARAGCWYDLSGIPPAQDGRRRCPECGRRPRPRRMRATRRSVVTAGVGLVLIGLAALLLEGRAIQRSGVAAMPSWVLVTLPFDERAWLDRQPVNSGSTFNDDAAAELVRRNALGLLSGLAADHMTRRVHGAMRGAGLLIEEEEDAALAARLRAGRVPGGVEYGPAAETAGALAAQAGVGIQVPDIDVDMGWTRQGRSGLRVPMGRLRAGLPAWEMSVEQALDLLCRRAGNLGLTWRATPAGVVLEGATGAAFTGFYDASAARAVPEASPEEMAWAVQDDALVYPGRTSLTGFQAAGMRLPPAMAALPPYRSERVPEPVVPAGDARTLLSVRWWISQRWDFLTQPARGEANSAFYRAGYGWGPLTGIRGVGSTLILEGTIDEHRRLAEVFEALAGPAAPPPADRDAILATLALLDCPGEIVASPNLSAKAGLALIAEQRGIEVVIDPVLVQHDEESRARERLVADLLRWRMHSHRAWVAGAGRALVTDYATRDLLTRARMYRLRIPAGRVLDPTRAKLDGLDPADVARAALRLVAPVEMLWQDRPRDGVVRFIARTADDEHALLTWVLEEVERSLETGRHSAPSATRGRPVAIYNLSARARPENLPEGWTNEQFLIAESVVLLKQGAIGSHAPGVRPSSWHQRSGCVFMARLTPEDHERFANVLRDRATGGE